MSDQFLSVKIPESLAARVGASGADFAVKLAAHLDAASAKLMSAEDAATVSANANTGFAARLEAVEAKLAAKPADVNRDELLTEARKVAKEEASASLSAILAKGGGAPLNAGEKQAEAKQPDFKALVASKIAAGKSKADAISDTMTESPALYAAWKAAGAGSL